MRTLGLRASPSVVTFAIFDTDSNTVINVEDILIPLAFETPDALKYIKNNVLDIIREYQIAKAGIRITEPNAQRMSIPRIQIEGVIQESFASSGLISYYTGQISSISARLGFERRQFKRFVDNEILFDGVDNWGELTKEQREAILCAMGAVNV